MSATEPRYCPISTLHRKLRQGTGSKGRATRPSPADCAPSQGSISTRSKRNSSSTHPPRTSVVRGWTTSLTPPRSIARARRAAGSRARAADRACADRAGPVFLAADGVAAGPARHSHRRRLRRRRRPDRTRSNSLRELGEDLAQVVLNPARADVQPGPDLQVRQAVAGQPRNVDLLGGQLASGLDGRLRAISPVASRSRLARSPNACTPIRVQHVASGGQLLPRGSTHRKQT